MMYKLYGLVIASDNPLTWLTSTSNRDADVYIRHMSSQNPFPKPHNWFTHWYVPGGPIWLSFAKLNGGYLLSFNELSDFFISKGGDEIICKPKEDIPPETIQHLILNQVIPLVINLKGGEALHASAVLTSYGVVAFSGLTGSGKSTVAGSFLKAGYSLMSDDCLTLFERDSEIYATPAYPHLRLWEDSVVCLFNDSNIEREPVAHYTQKCHIDIEKKVGMCCKVPQPFRRVYEIVDSPEIEGKSSITIERLFPRDSFITLVRCAFRLDITDRKMLERQFCFLEKVVSKVSVRRITFPKDFNLLPAVREAILKDLQDLNN